jgi:hypothetical protein
MTALPATVVRRGAGAVPPSSSAAARGGRRAPTFPLSIMQHPICRTAGLSGPGEYSPRYVDRSRTGGSARDRNRGLAGLAGYGWGRLPERGSHRAANLRQHPHLGARSFARRDVHDTAPYPEFHHGAAGRGNHLLGGRYRVGFGRRASGFDLSGNVPVFLT